MNDTGPVVAVTGHDLHRMITMFITLFKHQNNPSMTLHIWFDPLDQAVKLKLNNSTWSPPFGHTEGAG